MVDVAGSALRIYRRLLGVKPPAEGEHAGRSTAADGASAAAIVEACVADAAALGASFPAAPAALRFRAEAERVELNHFRRPVRAIAAQSGRESLAGTVGLSLAGMRATAFLSGDDLVQSLDHLGTAVGRGLPLVVHLAARARAGRGAGLGGGHEALYAAAERGAAVFVASTVQEIADFALIARRFAEDALHPAVVAADGAETLLSAQDVRLPLPDLTERYVGDPGDMLHPGSPAQEMLHGKHRRRVPRRHDLERPSLNGALTGPESHFLAGAARFAFLDGGTGPALARAFAEFAKETGRSHEPVSAYKVDDARIVFVAMGSTIEPLMTAVDALRKEKVKAGVIGVRLLCPFPSERIVELLKGKSVAAVVERIEPAFGADAPLTREIRALLARAVSATSETPVPRLTAKETPALATLYAGVGGHPVRVPDLAAAARRLLEKPVSPLFVGVDFHPAAGAYPKREVLLDALRRAYPGAESLGVLAKDAPLPPADATLFAVHRVAGYGGEALVSEAALLFHRLFGGMLRTRSSLSWEAWDADLVDRLLHAPGDVRDPGDGAPCDLLLWHPADLKPRADATRVLKDGGVLLVETPSSARSVWDALPGPLRADVQARGLKLYVVKPQAAQDAALRDERLLGALTGVLKAEGKLDLNTRKLLAARRELLEDMDDPSRDLKLAAFQNGLESAMAVETGSAPKPGREPAEEIETPLALRHLGKADDTLDRLRGFWDRTGVFYRTGATEALSPDPFLASGEMPALSSTFRDHARSRDQLPEFHADTCTGCGDCWTLCPDSAMSGVAVSATAFLEGAMKAVKERGGNAEPLRMAVGKLAGRLTETLASDGGGSAGPLLDAAFTSLLPKLPLNDERKAAMTEAFQAVRAVVADVPLARTAPFFTEPEAARKGSGELFAIGINAQACKGCGVCVAACEPQALTREKDTPERTRKAREIWGFLAELPDPSAETVERMRAHSGVGALAGTLLNREARLSLAGGDGAEAGSGEKIALRQTLAAMEYHLLPRAARSLAMVDELREKLAEAVRAALAGALPTSDLEALAKGISSFDTPDTDLAAFTSRVEAAFDTGRVDLAKLRRLVKTAQDVNTLRWRLAEGPGGLGRARFGLVVAAGQGCAWAASFPYNPFHVPVTADDTADGAALARGILEGQYQEVLEGVRILRRAKGALERPSEARHLEDALARLTWRDLTEEERELAPALILVGTDATLGAAGRSGLGTLLDGDLPVKVLLLADPGSDLGEAPSLLAASLRAEAGGADPELLPLSHPKAYVVQTTIAHPEHLERGVAAALNHPGPALMRVLAPRPYAHGFDRDAAPARARRAVATRAYPLFAMAPAAAPGEPPSLDLSFNPDPDAAFPAGDKGQGLTFADWANGERRFARHFTPVTQDDLEPTPLGEYLLLAPADRAGKTPVLCCGGDELPLRVSPAMVEASERRLRAWRYLQQMAGSRSFAQRAAVEAAVAEAVSSLRSAHQAELDALRAAYEGHIGGLEAQWKIETAHKVRHRLLAILNRPAGNGGPKE